ncbi:DoxX family protein [Candidatus Coxiella mudrowiae]|uniref:DoxX family protein n=1 Tax=Candidatus Coxiella mudrowiae TaxID=2054173 RepID=UPI00190FFE09|nr:DoxX family protein [Candidatus Coxiella mudrowiae]
MDYNWTLSTITQAGFSSPRILLILAIIFEFSGGITSLFRMVRSIWCVFIEFLLLIFVLAVTFVFHTFWTYQAQEATNQMQHFTKNFSIIGGRWTLHNELWSRAF